MANPWGGERPGPPPDPRLHGMEGVRAAYGSLPGPPKSFSI
jgi:hypothetical protein